MTAESHTSLMMATNLTNIPVDEIRALVDERARYEGWIGALESRRGQTPPHVYDRVRADYDGRLGKVMDRLGVFVAPLREGEGSLAGREDELERSIGDRRDELAEIELRTAVGEYEAEEGERLRAAKEEEVQGLEADRSQVQEDLETVRELLGRSLPPGEQSAVPQRRAAAGPTSASEAPAAEPAAPEAEAPTAPAGATAVAGERREYEEWTDPAAAARAQAVPAGQPQAAGPTTYPAAGMPDQEKTLRCPDCGAMNYPTEWYCEKCGGELAAL
jgi:hypothetical protein